MNADEPRLYKRGKTGIWWADFANIGGIRHKRSTRETNKAKAVAYARRMRSELIEIERRKNLVRLEKMPASSEWHATIATQECKDVLMRLWRNARSRARKSKMLWALSLADFMHLVESSDGKCKVTSLPFTITEESRHPFKPSLDRIDNSLGYSLGNCRLVLMVVNYAMNVYGEELFRTVAFSFAATTLNSQVQKPAQLSKLVEATSTNRMNWGG